MGLLVDVYRNGDDTTLDGLSSTHDTICVVNADGPFEPSKEFPAFELVVNYGDSVALKPVMDRPEGTLGPMAGGNFGATHDSRFSQAIEKITGLGFYGAVAIHDRFESNF